jgi:hypothetical protein
MSSRRHQGQIWLGLDVHKDSISVGILGEDDDVARTDRIGSDEEAVRRLIDRVEGPRAAIRCCYEAGPTGYELHRLLTGMGMRFQNGIGEAVSESRDRMAPDRDHLTRSGERHLARIGHTLKAVSAISLALGHHRVDALTCRRRGHPTMPPSGTPDHAAVGDTRPCRRRGHPTMPPSGTPDHAAVGDTRPCRRRGHPTMPS